jgi:hypothetical protein
MPNGVTRHAWTGSKWPVRPMALVTGGPYIQKFVEAVRELWPPVEPERLTEHIKTVEGIFIPLAGHQEVERDLEDPAYRDGLFREASTVRPHDKEAVTVLVSRWGVLGVGPEPFETPPGGPVLPVEGAIPLAKVDSFLATRRELEAFQRHLRWLKQLKRGRSTDTEWRKFSQSLEPHLAQLKITMRLWPGDAHPSFAFTVTTPCDVLWATLWGLATRGGQLRECPHCHVLFPVGHPRQKFCSVECTNRASAARWYRNKGRKLRAEARRRTAKRRTT